MKSFARHLRSKRTEGLDAANTEDLLDAAELDIAPLGLSNDPGAAPEAGTSADLDPLAAEAADFSARLSDLDRFIGVATPPAPPTVGPQGSSPAPIARPTAWSGGAPARNLPAAPIPAVAPISHPRPAGSTPPPAPAPAPTPQPAPDARVRPEIAPADPDAEAQEFLDRLSDLDRFIGGGGTTGSD